VTGTHRKNLKNKRKKAEERLAEAEAALAEAEKEYESKEEKHSLKNLIGGDGRVRFDRGPKLEVGKFKVKIADLGNACWTHHHFATEIQTRQYRSPEVLLGSMYDISSDLWSMACMTYEMLTADLLFNPRRDQEAEAYGKNDDHIAQMMELLGKFPKKFSLRGVKSRKYMNQDGTLRRISRFTHWALKDVIVGKFRIKEAEA
jgi:serine/threonine-protein kinase SRPK3